ncbi:HTH-type transcriptional regulator IscR [anaerobic digester metagenome]
MLAKSTQYAIRALVYIQLQSYNQKRPGLAEIAKEIEAPEAYTAKIMQILTKHKLLSSVKGRGGGFFFSEKEPKTSLYSVIVVMEGDSCFTSCAFGLSTCSNGKPCPLHDKYGPIKEAFLKLAQEETIQTLAKKIEHGNAVINLL